MSRHDQVELVEDRITDPISDYLTRVRNALAADHPSVEVPSSRLRKEMTRILKEQGYITSFTVEPATVGEVIRIELKYTDDRSPVISGLPRLPAGGAGATCRPTTFRECWEAWAPPSSPPPPA